MYLYLCAFRYVCLHALHIHVCVYVCMNVLTYVYMCVCMCLHVYVYLYICACMYAFVHIHTCTRACVFVCMYVRCMLMILNKVRRKITYL